MSKRTSVITCSIGAILAIVISQHGGDLKISPEGMELIGSFESCRNDSYYCPAHVVTAGVGHTGNDVSMNKIYSNDEIAKWWTDDTKEAEACVDKSLKRSVTQGQYDAYVSFAFNKGCGNWLKGSPLKYANLGNKQASCQYLLAYDKAKINGVYVVLKGLQRRAKAEYNQCMKEGD